jgi:DNA-directed RNA polymerase sigma subunit (sigma70/sigma32)
MNEKFYSRIVGIIGDSPKNHTPLLVLEGKIDGKKTSRNRISFEYLLNAALRDESQDIFPDPTQTLELSEIQIEAIIRGVIDNNINKPKDKKIAELRLGLGGNEPRTFEQIAQELQLSKALVARRWRNRISPHLRNALKRWVSNNSVF